MEREREGGGREREREREEEREIREREISLHQLCRGSLINIHVVFYGGIWHNYVLHVRYVYATRAVRERSNFELTNENTEALHHLVSHWSILESNAV